MTLPKGFLFNQGNLQDYIDCQRRFQLRHMLQLAWPAVEAEPFLENERRIDQGLGFHKMIHQHLVGVPDEQIVRTVASDEIMLAWWNNYLKSIQDGILRLIIEPGNRRYEELSLSTPIGDFRLVAKYDLLVIDPQDRLVIFDWKTSQNHPRRKWLADRVQTHVYPFVLTQAASAILGGKQSDPDHIEMIYWFTNQPEQPERFPYSTPAYNKDADYLIGLVNTIARKSEAVFPLTLDIRRCQYCTYRSLCNRGVKPGGIEQLETLEESESPTDVNLDIDQIGEIEF